MSTDATSTNVVAPATVVPKQSSKRPAAMMTCTSGVNHVSSKRDSVHASIPQKHLTKRQKLADPKHKQFVNFRTRLNMCSAKNDCEGAVAVFQEMKAHPEVPRNNHMYGMLIALCAKAGDIHHGEQIFKDMEDLGLKSDEVIYSSMIKLYSDVDRVDDATSMFQSFCTVGRVRIQRTKAVPPNNAESRGAAAAAVAYPETTADMDSVKPIIRMKLRTVVPLFQAYARAKNVDAIEKLYEIIALNQLDPNEAILSAKLNAYNLVSLDSKKTISWSRIQQAVDSILLDMKENILSIGPSTKRILECWFTDVPKAVSSPSPSAFWRTGICIPGADGTYDDSGLRLTRIHIRQYEYLELANQVEKLVVRGSERRARQWKAFKEFIKSRESYDVFIDGANIGFYGQNKGGVCRISISQIEVAVEYWIKAGRRPLIVMHRHHRSQHKQHEKLFADWQQRGLLYLCERGNNDDWYWLWAAVNTANPDSLLISNDEMKDHHFNMLRPKYFRRWKIRHQTRFHFKWDQGQRCADFYLPSNFTRCVQTHFDNPVHGEAKDVDTSHVIAWHFPLRDEDGIKDPHCSSAGSNNVGEKAEGSASHVKISSNGSDAGNPLAASNRKNEITGSNHNIIGPKGTEHVAQKRVQPRFRPRVGAEAAVEADAGGLTGETRWFFARRCTNIASSDTK